MKGIVMNLSLLWLIVGIILILSEFIIPGFIICFFGAAAIITGILYWFIPSLALAWQILLFAVLGVVLLVACRRYMPGVFKGRENGSAGDIDDDNVSGNICVCTADIAPGVPGKVEFRGTLWNAVSSDAISAGSRCIIKSRNNITLEVEKA